MALKEISGIHPVAAMEDESAIFLQGDTVWSLGNIHWIDHHTVRDFEDSLLEPMKYFFISDRSDRLIMRKE